MRGADDNPLSRLPPHLRPGSARLQATEPLHRSQGSGSRWLILLSCALGVTLFLVSREARAYTNLKVEVAELRAAVDDLRRRPSLPTREGRLAADASSSAGVSSAAATENENAPRRHPFGDETASLAAFGTASGSSASGSSAGVGAARASSSDAARSRRSTFDAEEVDAALARRGSGGGGGGGVGAKAAAAGGGAGAGSAKAERVVQGQLPWD